MIFRQVVPSFIDVSALFWSDNDYERRSIWRGSVAGIMSFRNTHPFDVGASELYNQIHGSGLVER
jgi:hypothetical protein